MSLVPTVQSTEKQYPHSQVGAPRGGIICADHGKQSSNTQFRRRLIQKLPIPHKTRWILSTDCVDQVRSVITVGCIYEIIYDATAIIRFKCHEWMNPQQILLARHTICRKIPVRRRRFSIRSPTSHLTSVCHRGTCSFFFFFLPVTNRVGSHPVQRCVREDHP